jgi:transcriptional regulator with XRE-family HTH domain
MGLPLREVAKILDCDPSKISRIESGRRGIRTRELRDLLTEYGVPDGERAVLAGLASRTGQRGWWDQHADAIPEGPADYLQMESAAGEIMIYQPQLIPDLLQTRDYALAIAAADPATDTDSQREQVVAAKAARQGAVLLDGTASVSVIIGETAVRQQVGGPDVTAAQIGFLARAASTFPNLTVQVVPFTAGAHAATGCAPFTVLRFPSAPSLGVVYLEALSGGAYMDSPANLASCTRAFALLRAMALSPQATQEMLEDLTPPWE